MAQISTNSVIKLLTILAQMKNAEKNNPADLSTNLYAGQCFQA